MSSQSEKSPLVAVYNGAMSTEKTPPIRSFSAIPRERFKSAAKQTGNKVAAFKEEAFNMSRIPTNA